MRPIPKETMMTVRINIENNNGRKTDEKNTSDRVSSHAIFLFDGLDNSRKQRIEKIIGGFSEDELKISKMGCSAFGNCSENEKKEIIFKALIEKIKSGVIGSDTIIFMNFHTHIDSDRLYFSIKGVDKNIRIPVEEIYQCVWSHFPGDQKPSFHNLGCNTGYFSKDQQYLDSHVINYAGESTIGQKEGISQANEVLRFVSLSIKFNGSMPESEKIWQHMESHATQEMSITGKGSFMVHKPMELPASMINGYFNPLKGHKNPKLLIEYAFRHRPMEQVQKLIEIHDPKYRQLKNMGESAKTRLLFHIIPNRVTWENFNQHVVNVSFLEKSLVHTDSLQKLLFLKEHGLLPNPIGQKRADRFLLAACTEGNAKVAELILAMPEFRFSDSGKRTALLEAIKSENVELVQLLTNHAPDFYIQNQNSNTVFHFASSQPTAAIIELLLKPDFLMKFPGGSTAERKKTREHLLNYDNKDGQCPLELAIKKNCPEIVRNLLDAGADPDRLNSKGKTFLHQAVFRGSPAVVELLLARFPETSGEKIDLSMLIRKAILRSEKKIAMMLIEYCGAAGKTQEINTPDASGTTPLMLAAKIKDVRLITALLDAGADPAARSNSGRNVLHKISKEISPNQKNSILLNKNLLNTESENFLHQKINFSQIENLVKKFIARGVSVNDADSAGNTPALIAAREKNIPLVKLLLSQGADINAKNKDGYTLLHYALQNKDTNLSRFLVENGATFDAEHSAI